MSGPVRTVMKGALANVAAQGWVIGQLDAALMLLQNVKDEADENLQRHPKDEPTKRAVLRLSIAMQNVTETAEELSAIALGDGKGG